MTGGRYRPLTTPEMERIHMLVLQLLADLGLSQITPSLAARALAVSPRIGQRYNRPLST